VPATIKDAKNGKFNMYRVSRDIAPQFYSAMRNLQRMEPFLATLSGPGQWAFPDNLEVANTAPTGNFQMSPTEWRTHFAAWCITSSPLVLGFDLTDEARYREAYPIVSNKLALEINQAWAGEAGRLVKQSPGTFVAKTAEHAIDECEQGDLRFCQNITFPTWQLWAKTLPALHYKDGTNYVRVAVLLINLSPTDQILNFQLSDIDVGLASDPMSATEVWNGSTTRIDKMLSQMVPSHDSVFLVLSTRPKDDSGGTGAGGTPIALAINTTTTEPPAGGTTAGGTSTTTATTTTMTETTDDSFFWQAVIPSIVGVVIMVVFLGIYCHRRYQRHQLNASMNNLTVTLDRTTDPRLLRPTMESPRINDPADPASLASLEAPNNELLEDIPIPRMESMD